MPLRVPSGRPVCCPPRRPPRASWSGAQGGGFRGRGPACAAPPCPSPTPPRPGTQNAPFPNSGRFHEEVRDALGSCGDGGGSLRERPQAPQVTWCDLHPRRGRRGRSACRFPSRPPLLRCAPLALGQRAARQISCREDQPTALWGPELEGQQVPAGREKASIAPTELCSDAGPPASASGAWRSLALSLSLGGVGIPGLLLHHRAPGPDLPTGGGWIAQGLPSSPGSVPRRSWGHCSIRERVTRQERR